MRTDYVRRTIACAVLGLAAVGFAAAADAPTQPGATAIAAHGRLAVVDGRVVDRHGEPLSLAGPSLFWGNAGWGDRAAAEPSDYFNGAVVGYVRRAWNAPLIRIPMGVETPGGYLEDPDGRWQRIAAAADAALAEGMYFIVDWHSHHAEDHPDAAVAFFERVAKRYGASPNLIYEIYNEPLRETDWSTVIKPYAERVVAAIRGLDPDNLIVVGTQTWSQDVDKAADDPLTDVDNVAYALHFYAGTHGRKLRAKARYALERGLPLVVTEWGTVAANGDGAVDVESTRRWMEFLRKERLTHCNWSLHSKQEGASILTLKAGPDARWDEGSFSESGRLVRGIVQGWHAVDYGGLP